MSANADPEVRGLILSSMRGGDESRREMLIGRKLKEEARQVPLIALNDLGSAVGKSRLLCEGLWGRAFLTAYNSVNGGEHLWMV